MPRVQFTRHLQLHFPDLSDVDVPGGRLVDVIGRLDQQYPGLKGYLVDDRGGLRMHVNIFINEEILQDRVGLTDTVSDSDRVFIMQALSGG